MCWHHTFCPYLYSSRTLIISDWCHKLQACYLLFPVASMPCTIASLHHCIMLNALLGSPVAAHFAAFNLTWLPGNADSHMCMSLKASGDDLQAAVVMQKVWRGSLVRRDISLANSAATVVQRYWRGHAQHTKFRWLRGTTVRLQARVRQWQAVRRFAVTRAAAVAIQVFSMCKPCEVHAYHQQNKGLLHLICIVNGLSQTYACLC